MFDFEGMSPTEIREQLSSDFANRYVTLEDLLDIIEEGMVDLDAACCELDEMDDLLEDAEIEIATLQLEIQGLREDLAVANTYIGEVREYQLELGL